MFNIGDKVLYYRDHHDQKPVPHTVIKVQTTYVLIDNGSKFTRDGRQWGNSKAWFHSFIRHLDADLLAEIEQARLEQAREAHKRATVKAIVNFVSHDMTNEELDKLVAYLQNMGMPPVVI